MRVVLDTNVYISAAVFDGLIEEILLRASNRADVSIFISEDIKAEITRVLKRKMRWNDWRVAVTLQEFQGRTSLVVPRARIETVKVHSADNRILECAAEAGAHYIVSGDKKHLLPLKKYRGTAIVSPREFLSILEKQQ